ncbi:MAG: PLD nuclease N-terminal domain-containing protein [Acidimicrobiia bacterium]
MARLLGFGFVPLVLLALWAYCVFDVIASDATLIRNLPKGMWLVIVIFLPDLGSLAWLALGRPLNAGWRPGDTSRRAPRRVLGPEDRDDFPVREDPEARLRAWEENLRRREDELRRREDPPDTPAGS